MNYTSFFNLNKPELSDYADIDKLNANMETLDTALNTANTNIAAKADSADVNPTTTATTLADTDTTVFTTTTAKAKITWAALKTLIAAITVTAATKLATARTMVVNLASTATVNFDGSANATLGVSGILPVANGGTGKSSASGALAALGMGYTTCATAAATKAKTAALSDFALSTGALVVVQFTNGNTNSAMTLNVNSTGAKTVYWQASTDMSFQIPSGAVATFVYNGSGWVLLSCDAFANPFLKMETLSYEGTGVYGSSNPNTLTFSITPVLLMIAASGSGYNYGTQSMVDFSQGTGSVITYQTTHHSAYSYPSYFSLSGKTVSWYSNQETATSQLNTSGQLYTAVVWGY